MKELTKGHPVKVIILFAIPLMAGNILQQLYNMTDAKIVSMYVSTEAFAAISCTTVVSNTLIGFVNGLTQGFAIYIARCFGAREEAELRKYMAGTIVLTSIFAVVLTVFGVIFIKPILILLSTQPVYMQDALDYVIIIIAGMVFVSTYNMCSNVLRAVGDSVKPLLILALSVVLNISFDLFFIRVLGLGIKGAAYATVLAQAIAAFVCIGILVIKYKKLLPTGNEWKPVKELHSKLLAQGVSMGLMGCIVNLGTICLQRSINELGPLFNAAHAAGRRVFDILMIVIYTVGFSMTTYVSQNIGAGDGKRVRQGIRYAILIDSMLTTLLIGFTFLFGKSIVTWIASTTDTVIISNGAMYIMVGVCFYYVLGPLFILRCSLQGMGHKIVPLVSSFLELLTKILFAFILVPALGYFGVALTEPVSWCIMIIPLIVVYVRNMKELNVLVRKTNDSYADIT